MEAAQKRILRALSLALRHELEGRRDENGDWHAGDLERRLAELGVHRETSRPLDEMRHLSAEDRRARVVVDGYLQLRADASVERDVALAEFVRESAYTWANRLLALRCMEARNIIEEVVLQKTAYAGRSLVHQRFVRSDPAAAAGEDDGLFAVLFAEFAARAAELPAVFELQAAAVSLRPSVAALKRCVALLSGTETLHGQESATDEVFSAPDAFGWAYQYWNIEEKDRVFDAVRTKKGSKIEGADIIPATQLYTEPYMVRFLVQNSLGALWMSLHADSQLCDGWEYYIRDADRAPIETSSGGRSVRDFTFLDPALGSGHFHLEAFDLLFAMYSEENPALNPRQIAASILNRNLFGIDLDERAVQIAGAALWMKAKDAAPELEAADLDTFHDHLVATNIRLPRGRDHLEFFLERHPEDAALRPALELVFRGLEHADELGSLLQIEEPVDRELSRIKAEADTFAATPPVQPDMFRATAVQSRLPLGVESMEAWKAGALGRLKAHFEQEAEAADSVRAFFGASAQKGLSLFDLLARRYDTVAANPPYMGSKNMGKVLKSFIEQTYPTGKRDLYAAFILRCRGLAAPSGRVAMVTQQSWMFLGSYRELRAVNKQDANGDFDRGVLVETAVEVLAQLGRYAFSEIGNAVVQPVPFVLQKRAPSSAHRIWAARLNAPRAAEVQAALLREAAADHVVERNGTEVASRSVFRVAQRRLLDVPEAPICYWLREKFFDFLAGKSVADEAQVCAGLCSGNEVRFSRFDWETRFGERWVSYEKGGGYRKWVGYNLWSVDWGYKGARIRFGGYPGTRIQNERHYLTAGWVYSSMAAGSVGVRKISDSIWASVTADAVVPFQHSTFPIGAVLNCRIASAAIRWIRPQIVISAGYVARLPLPMVFDVELRTYEALCVLLKARLVGTDVIERTFNAEATKADGIRAACRRATETAAEVACCLHTLEGYLERQVFSAFGFDSDDTQAVLDEAGVPAAWWPLLRGYDSVPRWESVPSELPSDLVAALAEHPRRELSRPELTDLTRRLQQFFTAGFHASPQVEDTEEANGDGSDADEMLVVGAHLPIPTETFLEEISQKLELHPISVFWLLKEGLERDGWRCLLEDKRLTGDHFTVIVLRMLGHRWPKQVEAGEPLPEWADFDGVIPISAGSAEPPLAARVIDRLSEEFPGGDPTAIRGEFEEIVGARLEAWLASAFFARHISQFKRRPIAWQLQSQSATLAGRRRTAPERVPAFACLVYYHRLDADLLPKLRSHYLDGLRSANATELRTLEALAQPTAAHGARKAELEVLVDELNRFDAKLQTVVESGFGPAPLQPRLRQLAVDDAMLAMKARWLVRLSKTLQAAPLADWEGIATALGHHVDYPRWIAAAIDHLPRHCAKVGAKCPDAANLTEDPTSTTLAALICAETDSMTVVALDRACAEWKHEWETNVIDPLRERNSTASVALEALATELETLDRRNTSRVVEIAGEQKRLHAQVKTLRAEIKAKTEKAGQLAALMREWTSPELVTWESWLGSGPLFDKVSSLDGRRAAPATVRDFIQQESLYAPDLNDGVRVNIAPLQRAGILAADVLAGKDVDKAIADRAEWRADERRWFREGKLPQPGWWDENQ